MNGRHLHHGRLSVARGIVTLVALFLGGMAGALLGFVVALVVAWVWLLFLPDEGPEFPWEAVGAPVMLIVPVAAIVGAIVTARSVWNWTQPRPA